MSKVIVIERCGDCPCIRWTGEKMICSKTGRDIDPLAPDFDKYPAGAGMPDWCPLLDLPERKPEMEYLAVGYNKCLDDLLEGE